MSDPNEIPEDKLKIFCLDGMSYAFTVIAEAPKRFGKDEWRHPTAIRKLIEEAYVQGILYKISKDNKDGESERQETREEIIQPPCG